MSSGIQTNIMAQTDGDYLVVRPDRKSRVSINRIQSKIARIMTDNGINTYHSTPNENLHLTIFNHLNGPKSNATHSYGLTPGDRKKLMRKVAQKISTIPPLSLNLTLGKKVGKMHEIGVDAGSNLSFPLNLGVRLTFDTKSLDILRNKVCEAVLESGISVSVSKTNPKGLSHFAHEFTKNFRPHISIGTLDLASHHTQHRDVKLLNSKHKATDKFGNVLTNSDGTVKTYRKIEREIRRQLISNPSYGGMGGTRIPLKISGVELLGSKRLFNHDEAKGKKPSQRGTVKLAEARLGKNNHSVATITQSLSNLNMRNR